MHTTTYAARQACIRSNIEVHGARYAFNHELKRMLRAGRPFEYAFRMTCLMVFGRAR